MFSRLLVLAIASASAFHSPSRLPSLRLAARNCAASHAGPLACALEPLTPNLPSTTVTQGLHSAAASCMKKAAAASMIAALFPALALASSGEHLHTGQKVAMFFQKFGLPDWATLMIISMVPAVELRGGVPVGNWMGISPINTFIFCVIGNMLPIAPTILGLRSPAIKKLAKPLLTRAEKKLAGLPKGQSRTLALALFVGVPAPGTGAWTGAIIAYLLDMPFSTAMGAILAGVVLAGCIMTLLTLAGKVGALIALAALLLAGGGAIMSSLKADKGDEEPPVVAA